MTIHSGELYTPHRSAFEVRRGAPSMDVLDERRRFVVEGMNWLSDEHADDWDAYDSREDTFHFTRRDEDGSVVASMRLTPVNSIQESLSYEMTAANTAFQAVVRDAEKTIGKGEMWDLTRLIFPLDGSQDPALIHEAMIELYGMAAQASASGVESAEEDVYWVFTTTPWVLRFFNQNGIKSRTLAEGKLPDADGKQKTTLFCLVDVADAIGALKSGADEKHQRTYSLLRQGSEAAETGLDYV